MSEQNPSTPPEDNGRESDTAPGKTGLGSAIFNVLSAAFGVRSSKRRSEDITQTKFHYFVITAIGFVILFIATVFTVVKLVLKQSG